MQLEYIVVFKKDSSFCSNVDSLKKFIESDSNFKFENNNTIAFTGPKGKLRVGVHIDRTEIKEPNELCYYLKFSLPGDTEESTYTDFNRHLKTNFNKINSREISVNIVWDDFGLRNAQLAYPMINEIENLMRKFISKFMLVNFGMKWFESYIPKEIEYKIRERKQAETHLDFIYKTDFDHLSAFFFKKYREIDSTVLDKEISKGLESKTFDSKVLESYLPKSNWERHFANLVGDNVSENKLLSEWEALHGFRNEVAHNRFISNSDLLKIKNIYTSLKSILENLFQKIEQIDLNEVEKEITVNQYFYQTFLRISKIAKLYNLSLAKIIEVFSLQGIRIESNPNAKVSIEDLKVFDANYGGPSMLDKLKVDYPQVLLSK